MNQGKCPPTTTTGIEANRRKNAHIRNGEGPSLAPGLRFPLWERQGEAEPMGSCMDIAFIDHPLDGLVSSCDAFGATLKLLRPSSNHRP